MLIAAIWASLIIAVVAAIIALVFTVRANARSILGGVSLIILGLIDAAIFSYFFVAIQQASSQLGNSLSGLSGGSSLSSAYSAYAASGISISVGGWLCLLGMIAALIGGIIALVQRRSTPALATPDTYGAFPAGPAYEQQNSYPNYPPQNYPPQYPSQPPAQYPQYPPQQPQYPQPQYPPQQ